jgi:hypothetical protein
MVAMSKLISMSYSLPTERYDLVMENKEKPTCSVVNLLKVNMYRGA